VSGPVSVLESKHDDVGEITISNERSVAIRRRRPLDLFPYLLLLPAISVLAVIFLYPLGHSLWLSFHSLNLNRPWQGTRFVGFDNYVEQFTDPDFYHYLWLTFYWTAGSLVGQVILAFAAALALNQTFAGRAIARAVILIPWAVPTVLVAIVFGTMFNAQGIVNQILINAGLVNHYIPWLSSTTWSMPTIIMAHIWKGFPFLAVMILAGLQSIPSELYEAAEIDGASDFQQFRYITLPSLRGVTLIAILLSVIFSLKGIDFPYIMTFGGPANSTKVIAFHAYHTAFAEYSLGRASSIATILTLITAVISYYYLRARGTE
jgi:multiple sugar transport system permease protein